MSNSKDSATLNIGAVAERTGIPASTLRTWERRYGYPSPDRTDGGHRVYDPSDVERLELVADALDAGHRAGQVVDRPADELRDLLGYETSSGDVSANDEEAIESAEPRPRESQLDEHADWLPAWIEATRELNLGSLHWQFQDAWNRLGAIDFLQERITPYLQEVGIGWADGRFDIIHEHHASEVLRDFLSSKWRPLVERATGPKSMVGSPPGERHVLGLHMVAIVLATAGWSIGMLGPDVPLDELVRAVDTQEADVLAVTMASSYGLDRTRRTLAELRDRLPDHVELIAGGSGTPEALDGVRIFENLEGLYEWALERS